MKKTMISMVLLLGLLAGCSSDNTVAKAKTDKTGQIIATLTNDSKTVSLYADDVYNEFLATNTGSLNLFEGVYKAVIKALVDPEDLRIFTLEATEEMKQWVTDAKEQASTNKVSKDVMIEELLKEAGVETVDELKEQKIYEKVKAEVEKEYFDNNRDQFIKDWVNEYFPFHIRGILVKVSDNGDGSLYNRSITEAEAKKLNNAFTQLREGVNFIELAGNANVSDHGSGQLNTGGSLGIMDLTTGFNSEFKFGVYSYVARSGKAEQAAVDKLAIPQSYKDLYSDGFNVITTSDLDYLQKAIDLKENFTNLNDAANSALGGEEVIDSTRKGNYQSSLIARNVVFNNLFNSHAVSFLEATAQTKDKVRVTTGYKNGVAWEGDVVANSKGEPVLVLTDENGVQFISLDQNPFANASLTAKYYSSSADRVYYTVNNDNTVTYYDNSTEAIAADPNHKVMVPYVSQGYSDKSSRKSDLDSTIKNYINRGYTGGLSANEQFFQFSIFNKNYTQLKTSNKIKGFGTSAKGLELEKQVLTYIDSIIAYRDSRYAKAKVDNWKEIEKIFKMQNERSVWVRPLDVVDGTSGTFTSWENLVLFWSQTKFGGAL